MSDLHDALEALADQWSRPNASTWASSVAFAHDLRQLLAAHPHPVAPAPTGLREALEARIRGRANDETIDVFTLHGLLAAHPHPVAPAPTGLREALAEMIELWISRGPYGSAISDARDLLARFPAPVLPEGAVPLADGWHLRPEFEGIGTCWDMISPDGALVTRCSADDWRSVGQPVPEPAPTITVGCIVRTPLGMGTFEYRGEHDGHPVIRSKGGWLQVLNTYTTADLTFMAPSREAHGWPAIEESKD